MIEYDWFVPYPMTKLQCFFFSKAAKLDIVLSGAYHVRLK